MCDSSGYSLSHFNSLSTQVIGTNINFHQHLGCENFQSRQGTLACNIYDLHPSIKTNISNTKYLESMQIPSALHGFCNSFTLNNGLIFYQMLWRLAHPP